MMVRRILRAVKCALRHQRLVAYLLVGLLACRAFGGGVEAPRLLSKNVPVSGGRRLTVAGCVVSPGATQDVANAVVVGVRFRDGDGNDLSSGLLPTSADGGEYFYAGAATVPAAFRRDILVPRGSVEVEITAATNRPGRFEVEGFSVAQGECLAERPHPTAFLFKLGQGIVSVQFVLFAALILLLYFSVPMCFRRWVLIGGSVAFYSAFRPEAWLFLGGSVVSIYLSALALSFGRFRRTIVALAVALNAGALVSVKYVCPQIASGSVWVPLGMSFYTLQAIAYLVDVYRGECPAVRNPFRLLLFLSYFPAIMQGPISRYSQLGEQLWTPHRFTVENMRDGLQLMLWGFFKKVVIADRAALFVDRVFEGNSTASGVCVILAVVLYSIQIYADFSGCVDISRGLSQCLGIDLMQNFRTPYLSESVAEFWRRWHISLSSWLKDYIYIPLGGGRRGAVRKYLNVLIVFAISGVWHGVGVNFFIWGLLHGVYQIIAAASRDLRKRAADCLGVDTMSFSARLGRRAVTFSAVCFAWIFFRCSSFADACSLIGRMGELNLWCLTDGTLLKLGLDFPDWSVLSISVGVLAVLTALSQRIRIRQTLSSQQLWFRWLFVLIGLFSVLVFGVYGPGYNASNFIYMQF